MFKKLKENMTIMNEKIKTIKIKNHLEIQELKGTISDMKDVWGLTHGGLRMTGKMVHLKYRSIEIIQSENGKIIFEK